MSVERDEGWASGADRLLAEAARAARVADARVSAALKDLFLPDALRPSDRQRAAMNRMLDAVVEDLESALRLALIEQLGDAAPPALGVDRVAIVRPIFDRAGVLRDRDLVALLLVRAEEHRIRAALRRLAEADPEPPSPYPAGGEDPALELPLLIAESRQTDASGEPTLSARDLPADLLHRLIWWVAAALRDYLERAGGLDPARRDEALMAAVTDRLARHDEGETLQGAAMRAALARSNDDAVLLETFRSGRFSSFVAALAIRARIDHGSAFIMAMDRGIGALAVLLRATDVAVETAAVILMHMAAANGLSEARLEERVNDFLELDAGAAKEAVRPWRLDPAFRVAIADIGRERRAP